MTVVGREEEEAFCVRVREGHKSTRSCVFANKAAEPGEGLKAVIVFN